MIDYSLCSHACGHSGILIAKLYVTVRVFWASTLSKYQVAPDFDTKHIVQWPTAFWVPGTWWELLLY